MKNIFRWSLTYAISTNAVLSFQYHSLIVNITSINFWNHSVRILCSFLWNPYLKTDGSSLLILFHDKDPNQNFMKIIMEWSHQKLLKAMLANGLWYHLQKKTSLIFHSHLLWFTSVLMKQIKKISWNFLEIEWQPRVSVQGVKSLGCHFACLCRGFEFYEVKKNFLLLFFKKKMEILLHF